MFSELQTGIFKAVFFGPKFLVVQIGGASRKLNFDVCFEGMNAFFRTIVIRARLGQYERRSSWPIYFMLSLLTRCGISNITLTPVLYYPGISAEHRLVFLIGCSDALEQHTGVYHHQCYSLL